MCDTSNALVRSLVICDHTVLPATRHRWFSRLYPSMLPVLIYRPRKDERLSWPRWLVIPIRFTEIVNHPRINWARCTVWVKKIPPPLRFSNIFSKRLGIFNQFLHTYYTFPSTLDYKFLFNYLQFWRSYTILSVTTHQFFYISLELNF